MSATNHKKYFNEEELVLPLTLPDGKRIFSYDMGGSLFKLAYAVSSDDKSQVKIKMVTFSNHDLDDALNFIEKEILETGKRDDVTAYGSGIGSRINMEKLSNKFDIKDNNFTDEFVCFGKGLHYMLTELDEPAYLHPYEDATVPSRAELGMNNSSFVKVTEEEELTMRAKKDSFPALLGFFGSGLGFILVDEDGSVDMVGGAAAAGLAFHSLGKVLTGAKSYEELMEFAGNGDSRVCTTTLDDMSVGEYAEMDLQAFNEKTDFVFEVFPFGNIVRKGIKNPRKEDLARSLLHMVCDSVITTVLGLAKAYKLNKCYLAGSFFAKGDIAKQYLARLPTVTNTVGWPVYPRYLKFEGYIGVLGAIIDHFQAKK
ncbi:uncharacterized protein LOC141911020 [Tubulanus polymorphus]|uniref:uncharacterized protein LOC141911020 n=1 Tax=Tubulanus polymorphus TaxID=672921 RepID=UPI003DA207EE